jgi:Ca2+-binding RTX toxin-like protein
MVNDIPTNYFYSSGLNASMDEFDALPEGSSSTDVLRALFEGTEDTVYTKADLDGETEDAFLPEGFENVVIEGYGNTKVVGNTQDNIITGNAGNNIIDGGEGNDTFITQGNFDQSTNVLNQDGSVTLTSASSGTDTLINIEQVQFDDGVKHLGEMNFYTEVSTVLPEWLNNIIIEGNNNPWVIGNNLNNQITGNTGNNVIDGKDGVDTFVTQGNFDQSTGILNLDGSVRLISDAGGSDLLVDIEHIQFDDQLKSIEDVIDITQPTYTDASLYISDDFNTLETYFFGDTIGEANDLIADKVELAWDLISSSTLPYQTSVYSD